MSSIIDLVMANLCSRLIFICLKRCLNLNNFAPVEPSYQDHARPWIAWGCFLLRSFLRWTPSSPAICPNIVMIWEWSLMNVASSLIPEYDLFFLKLLVEDSSKGYVLLKGMSFSMVVRIVL